MPVRNLLLIAGLLGACTPLALSQPPLCRTDAQCPSHQVCFPDGCGDPGKGLVVEVTGDNASLLPQDIVLGSTSATMNLDVRGPITLVGRLQRRADNAAPVLDYTGGVTITANGQSALIPGITRRYSLTLAKADLALYDMPVGSGRYTVTARPADRSIPARSAKVHVEPGQTSPAASFVFQALDESVVVTGVLGKTLSPRETFISGLAIQAFDAIGGEPLSQLATVNTRGEFQLYLEERAKFLQSVTLLALPGESTQLVPTKAFVVPQEQLAQHLRLELGDFGPELPVAAMVVDGEGQPIAKALVTVEGKVKGGGTFRSQTVLSDAEGRFTVNLLPEGPEAPLSLTAIPPANSRAGILVASARVALLSGQPAFVTTDNGSLVAKTKFECPQRLKLGGTVLTPDGNPAAGVVVEAVPVEAIDAQPVPRHTTKATTDAQGLYELYLDPARYRLDYIPAMSLPRLSRLLRVDAQLDADGGVSLNRSDLGGFTLSVGRTLKGLVTVRPNTIELADAGSAHVEGSPLPNALVRFYRVTGADGVDSSLLIGEAVSDERGSYTVVLPDRPSATSPAP